MRSRVIGRLCPALLLALTAPGAPAAAVTSTAPTPTTVTTTAVPTAAVTTTAVTTSVASRASAARPVSAPTQRAPLRPRHRSDWNAENPTRALTPLRPRGVIVHHTTGTNGYSREQVPAMIRALQQFHVHERGWNDIGYHLVVDRFGRVWEGRRGGLTRPVEGAHASGLNSHHLGIAYLGDTDTAPVSDAAVATLSELIGWAAARYGFSPEGMLEVDGRRYRTVAGHRLVGHTSCPGRSLSLAMPGIRVRATARAAVWRDRGSPWTYAG